MQTMPGEIVCFNKICTEWKIPNFSTYFSRQHLRSPLFCVSNEMWYLKTSFYPSITRPYFQVSLCSEYRVKNITVTFTLGVKDINSSIKYKPETRTFGLSKEWQLEERYFLDELPKLLKNFKKDNTLTIYFEVTNQSIAKDAGSQCSPLYSTYISCGDLANLLYDEQSMDVRIEVSNQEFRAHKLILQARSPVFEAMFRHNMKEATEGIVKINDCDPEIFQQFLQCMYTGKVEKLLPENAARLYMVADKYCVKELKEKCAIFMTENLSLDTVCDVLILSGKHDESDLKNSAEQFLIQNIEAILFTDRWKSLMKDHSEFTSQILLKVVENGINSKAKENS